MTDTTTTTAPELAAGLAAAEGWRLVEAIDPAPVEALDKARATYDAEERDWHKRNNDYQRSTGIPRRRVTSPHAKALREAAAAVADLCGVLSIRGLLCEI